MAQICDAYHVLPTDDRIRKLTWFQIVSIIWHPRKDGAVVMPEPQSPTLEDRFRDKWKAWGMTDEQIERKFEEFWLIEGERDRLERAIPYDADRDACMAEVNKQVADYAARIVRNRKWGR